MFHMQGWLGTVFSSVVSGVAVAVIITAARLVWYRFRVPSALSRSVRRRSYLGAVRAESKSDKIRTLDVYAPNLQPAKGRVSIAGIQSAWGQINQKGKVRVLTLDLEQSLQAGAELLNQGIEVRVLPGARRLGCDGLTYHLFETAEPEASTAIINHHRGDADRPVRIKGVAPTEVLRRHFRDEWDTARPLEAVVAKRILRPGERCGPTAVLRAVERAERSGLHLAGDSCEKILTHLAFRDSCAVVFIVGLPGSGKSYLRSRLEQRLVSMHVDCQSLTDYPYAYRDLLHAVLKLPPSNGNGFKSHDGGAFTVMSERSLIPALRALRGEVRDTSQTREVTLVEFARADLVAALQEFDEIWPPDIKPKAWVIHLSASQDVRLARLASRAVPPEVRVDGQAITVRLSDNHLLPAIAAQTLYTADGWDRIKAAASWRECTFEISNESDGGAQIEEKISEFIAKVVSRYQASLTHLPARTQPVSLQP